MQLREAAHQTRPGYGVPNQSFFLKSSRRHASARLRLVQGDTNMALNYVSNTTKQKTHNVVVKDSKRRSRTVGKMTISTKSHSLSSIGQMLGCDTWTILQKSTSFRQHCTSKGIDAKIYLRNVGEDKQAPPLQQRTGHQGAKKAWLYMHKQVRQDCAFSFVAKVERQRLRNQRDPSMQRYLEWLLTDCSEYFAERHQPTSSSSWTLCSSFWTSSSWISDWHQYEWKDGVWSEKWQVETTSTQVSRSRSWH